MWAVRTFIVCCSSLIMPYQYIQYNLVLIAMVFYMNNGGIKLVIAPLHEPIKFKLFIRKYVFT